MKKTLLLTVSVCFLAGCATKMVYLNTQKTRETVQKDKAECEAVANTSDFKDPDLKQKKLNQCMQDKGYKVVSEDQAEKMQGFQEVWIKPDTDFKSYEAIFIDRVDVSQIKTNNRDIPDIKITGQDINNLEAQMLERFSKTLNVMMPVITDREKAAGKKVLYINLKLKNIAATNVGLGAALEVAGQVSGLPLPDAPQGLFSFEAVISDFVSQEKLITISGEAKEDKNASLAGLEKFDRWKHAYNIMDYWADHLAELIAKERQQKYKSQLKFKII